MTWLKIILWGFLVMLLTFVAHEGAHGLAGAALGYDMVVKMNGTFLAAGAYRSSFDSDFVSVAGPVVTLLQGFLALGLALKLAWRPAFTVGLAAFLMRVMAAGASLGHPNDEARLGLAWHLGYWPLHALDIALLLAIVVLIAKRLHPSVTEIVVILVTLIASVTMVVLVADPILPAVPV